MYNQINYLNTLFKNISLLFYNFLSSVFLFFKIQLPYIYTSHIHILFLQFLLEAILKYGHEGIIGCPFTLLNETLWTYVLRGAPVDWSVHYVPFRQKAGLLFGRSSDVSVWRSNQNPQMLTPGSSNPQSRMGEGSCWSQTNKHIFQLIPLF